MQYTFFFLFASGYGVRRCINSGRRGSNYFIGNHNDHGAKAGFYNRARGLLSCKVMS